MTYKIFNGDCLEVLKTIGDNSIESIVTDPPYGISFMGKKWDYQVPSVEIWKECLRVLKPGGHLLAFAGTRTQHRMACNIEDAGFEIRDMIAWVYGCLSEDTNILTMEGEKPYTAIKPGDYVLCYNKCSREYSYQQVEKVYEYTIKDTAFRIQSDFTDQIVSRNHRCIVERGGREVFRFAEELNSQENIPFLEDVSSLQSALSNLHERTSVTEKDVFKNLLQSTYRREKLGQKTFGEMRGYNTSCLLSVWNYFLPKQKTFRKSEIASVFSSMQWHVEGGGVENSFSQRKKELEARIGGSFNKKDDWTNKSKLERRHNIQEAKGELQRSKNCSLSERIQRYGEERWLHNGTSFNNGTGDWKIINPDRGGSSYKSQPFGQQNRKFNIICNKQGPQTIREWGGHKTCLATVNPIQYEGKIWCVKVPTGSFVAVRNGKAFVTGNSGMPKSHDVSKAIDKAAGVEREVLGISPNSRPAQTHGGAGFDKLGEGPATINITAPATPEAQQWEGWGSALKPALEPITLARKPLEGTIAANVLEHETGALNIDGCRVGTEQRCNPPAGNKAGGNSLNMSAVGMPQDATGTIAAGRWPANLILTYPKDEYKLKDNITPQQLAKLAEWMNENA
jgi:hypothetical protein